MSAPSQASPAYEPLSIEDTDDGHRVAPNRVKGYLNSLFPFLGWIGRYNTTWLASDLIAGVTVGAIVVPQGMAYASLAKLEPQFGLYSSFVGVMIYWLFGTSKDISIGPVAVLSTIVGNLVTEVNASGAKVSPFVIAASLSVVTGVIVLLLGLFRCGALVNLVSAPALSAFMTGSAITIAMSRVPSLLGLTSFSSREPPYKVLISIISNLGSTDLNAVLGVSALLILYSVRFGFTVAAERAPKYKHSFAFFNSMRSVAVIILFTLISWLAHWTTSSDQIFAILGDIPRGFQHFGLPPLDLTLGTTILPYIPATVVVMIVEHMAIAKSFGRANNYEVNPSQEMVAIGMTNVLGPFFGGYASTGSFSRTAIQAKAGARSPVAGIVTGMVVLLAVYLLTAAFYYIPSAVLAAVIIHAVGDLITPPSVLRQYWTISPLEVLVFAVGVVVSVFKSIEAGLYASVAISSVAYLWRSWTNTNNNQVYFPHSPLNFDDDIKERGLFGSYGTFQRETERSGINGHAWRSLPALGSTPTGTVFCRIPQNLSYINSTSVLDSLVQVVHKHTSRTTFHSPGLSKHEPWSATPEASEDGRDESKLPPLTSVMLDFDQVQFVDATAAQKLFDMKLQLDSYASPSLVDWRVFGVGSEQVQRALYAAALCPNDGARCEPDTRDEFANPENC